MNTIDATTSAELHGRHGDVFTQALLGNLNKSHSDKKELDCMDVLQMSEIAHRLRSHIREMITDYRNLDAKSQTEKTDALREQINVIYHLYRETNQDFHQMFFRYMDKINQTVQRTRRVHPSKTVVQIKNIMHRMNQNKKKHTPKNRYKIRLSA